MNGYVYFIQAVGGGPIKIGWSEKPERRLQQLQSAHHEELRILSHFPASRGTESALHAELADHKLSGEWFTDSGDVRRLMRLGPSRARAGGYGETRLRTIVAVDRALKDVALCRSEDDAAAIFAEAGRSVWRIQQEIAA